MTVKTIGILHSRGQNETEKEIDAFLSTLDNLGYSHAKGTLTVQKLYADDDPKKKKDHAKTLATTAGINLIVAAGGSETTYAVKKATEDAQADPAKRTSVVFTTFS